MLDGTQITDLTAYMDKQTREGRAHPNTHIHMDPVLPREQLGCRAGLDVGGGVKWGQDVK